MENQVSNCYSLNRNGLLENLYTHTHAKCVMIEASHGLRNVTHSDDWTAHTFIYGTICWFDCRLSG